MYNVVENLGIQIPSILLPAKNHDLAKWSVVACDQYTSQPEYWKKVEEIVGSAPSTLQIVFPEVYLEEEGSEERIGRINKAMLDYISNDVLVEHQPGFIYVDRQTSHSTSRKGLILAVDLEKYDYGKGSQSLIRATEGTVIERLPPRIKIRQNASIETPHIMLLIDDPEKTVIEPLDDIRNRFEKLYDFDLMLDGMHITGYKVDDEGVIANIVNSLNKLANKEIFSGKYGVGTDMGVLLFAVGDGNHSLASAKGHWENIKKGLSEFDIVSHPARFALVEVVNVHDSGLKFEPIHRVLFNVNSGQLLEDMVNFFNSNGSEACYRIFDTMTCMIRETNSMEDSKDCHVIPFIAGESSGTVIVKKPKFNLEVGTLQNFLDDYCSKNPLSKIDYIHGSEVVNDLGSKEGNIGFILPAMDKCDLFKTVILDGALPRKTFSMGEAEEKRFYLECRKIVR